MGEEGSTPIASIVGGDRASTYNRWLDVGSYTRLLSIRKRKA
jgi:hypothetical protein